MDGERFYSTRVMCRMAGVTYRQADYWCRALVIEPEGNDRGSGIYRRWTYEQVRVMAFLREVAALAAPSGAKCGKIALLAQVAQQLADDPTLLDQPGLYVDLRECLVSLTRRPFAVWLPDWAYAVHVAAHDVDPAVPV